NQVDLPLTVDTPITLNTRRQQILKTVVYDYTETRVPVGSQAVAAQLASWSPATIRNELARLVDTGHLLQPHTSAGRVPSDLGYRYYVDFLMEEEEVPAWVRQQVDPHLVDLPLAVEEVLEVAAMVLALTTDSLSIVTGPRSLGARLKHLDLVSLEGRGVLLLVVLEGNEVRQRALQVSREVEQRELSQLALELDAELRRLGAWELPALGSAPRARSLRDEIVAATVSFVHTLQERQHTVIVHDGVRNLLRQPEFDDVERVEEVLEVVEEERVLGGVLASLDLDEGVSVMIGRESGIEQLNRCSLVLTTYRAGRGRVGTIGVLGPTRMRYSQVAPRVRYVSQLVGSALSRLLD
ncbi:MAG TPA: heat-inducible transcriptional repressor HrcA, partial [Candidatus Sulfotelmatobacter sp.]|nr:heat-inducible transcriptional repressor HrcA [Candidatus Sulfotelmatobacter sp.]